jgi:hypothetical protein
MSTFNDIFSSVFIYLLLFFLITGCVSGMGDKSVEDVYREAELREKGMEDDPANPLQPKDGESPPSGAGATSPMETGSGQPPDDPDADEAASRALRDRYQKFLAAHRNKVDKKTDCDSNICSDSAQNGIKNLRIKNLGAQLFDTGTVKITQDLVGFMLYSEAWGEPFFLRHNFGFRKTIGLSFDENTLQCGNCGVDHRILSGRGGPDDTECKIFVLADQAFPSGLVPDAGSSCVHVLRMEYCSPNELVDLFLRVTRGCNIPAGSVIFLGSLTHLADTGITAYLDDLGRAATKLVRIFQGGVTVLPVPLFPPAAIADPMITRALADYYLWAGKSSTILEGGSQCSLNALGKWLPFW